MSSLQKVNLGTPPTAVDGDTSRGANTKMNSNVDVLNAQATLTSAAATITAAQALTAAHVGKRVNISLAAAGTINLPPAATMTLDGVILLRNIGTTLVTLAIAAGSGDTLSLTTLAAGESAEIDSDGVHTLRCLMRGRPPVDPGYMPLAGGVFSGAPTYSTPAVARQAFQNIGASRALVIGSNGRTDFAAATNTPLAFISSTDQGGNWSGNNTFVTPVAGIYRFRATVCVASAIAAGNAIEVGLIRSSDNGVLAHERVISTGTTFFNAPFETTIALPAGAGYYFYIYGSVAFYVSPDSTFNRMCIEQLA